MVINYVIVYTLYVTIKNYYETQNGLKYQKLCGYIHPDIIEFLKIQEGFIFWKCVLLLEKTASFPKKQSDFGMPNYNIKGQHWLSKGYILKCVIKNNWKKQASSW